MAPSYARSLVSAEGEGFEPKSLNDVGTEPVSRFEPGTRDRNKLGTGRRFEARQGVEGCRGDPFSLAEGEGFEPSELVKPAQQFSRLPPSSARPSLQIGHPPTLWCVT